MELKDRIKKLRADQHKTLEQVAQAVGVSKSTVRKWECGDIVNMRRDKISKLAAALNTTPEYLMGWNDSLVVADDFELVSVYRGSLAKVDNNKLTERMRYAFDQLCPSDQVKAVEVVEAISANAITTRTLDIARAYDRADEKSRDLVDIALREYMPAQREEGQTAV